MEHFGMIKKIYTIYSNQITGDFLEEAKSTF